MSSATNKATSSPPTTPQTSTMAAPKPTHTASTLIDLTHTTRTLLTHLQSSLATPSLVAPANPENSTSPQTQPPMLPTLHSTTALLRANTTTLSLLLLTPPLTPSALYPKITTTTDVLLTMVAALTSPSADKYGDTVLNAARLAVRRVLSAWAELLGLVGRVAERVPATTAKDATASKDAQSIADADRAAVLAATGVVWECCEAVERVVADGVVGTVVRKAGEWRGVLVDAVQELKEWGEECQDDDDDDDDDEEGGGVGSGDEDEMFGAANRLGKGESEVRTLLEGGVKRLKMVGMLYQALVKRRLRTFPVVVVAEAGAGGSGDGEKAANDLRTLNRLMALLKGIPETVDDLASAFYDLDAEEAGKLLKKCEKDAVEATRMVEKSWEGQEDEFSTWVGKWRTSFQGVE